MRTGMYAHTRVHAHSTWPQKSVTPAPVLPHGSDSASVPLPAAAGDGHVPSRQLRPPVNAAPHPNRSVTTTPAPATTASLASPAQPSRLLRRSPARAAAPGQAAAGSGRPRAHTAAGPPQPRRCSRSQHRWDVSPGANTGTPRTPQTRSARRSPSWGAKTMLGEGDRPAPVTQRSPAPCPGWAGQFPFFPSLRS